MFTTNAGGQIIRKRGITDALYENITFRGTLNVRKWQSRNSQVLNTNDDVIVYGSGYVAIINKQ